MSLDKVSDKIRKLLALAQSSNQHESELALQKAQELMLEHNLTEQTLTAKESEYVNEVGIEAKKRYAELYAFTEILNEHYFVNTVICGVKFRLLGKKDNVDAARYVLNFLITQSEHLFDLYKFEQPDNKLKSKKSFYLGVARGFNQQLRNNRAKFIKERGLIIVRDKDLDTFIKVQYPSLGTARPNYDTNQDEFNRGYSEGLKLKLTAGLSSESNYRKSLT